MAAHLMEKSNQLHSAHVHQTMAFYTRLKDYIAFISKPSVSPSDARVKQQMADKILGLMRAEENKLLADQRPIGNVQLFICFIKSFVHQIAFLKSEKYVKLLIFALELKI